VRRVGVVIALTVAACGTGTTPDPQHTAWSDQPKLDLPRSQDTPESYVVPTTRPARQRAARSSTRPRTAPPAGDVWHALAQCESTMRQEAVGEGKYLSYFQWDPATWRSVGGEGDPRDASYGEQVERAKQLQARSGWGQWPRCSRKLGLR
jgi:hypothetical protein